MDTRIKEVSLFGRLEARGREEAEDLLRKPLVRLGVEVAKITISAIPGVCNRALGRLRELLRNVIEIG